MPDRVETPGQPPDGVGCPFFLSERQRQVLSYAAQGYTDLAIARRLVKPDGQPVKARTVRAHLQAVRVTLGALNTTHAVAIAIAVGLITVEVSTLKLNTNMAN